MRSLPFIRLARLGSWGVADQAVQSIANFLTLIVFARSASPGEFGMFALALTGITFEVTLAGAALSQPFSVIGASRSGGDYRQYVTSVLLAHVAFAALVATPILSWALLAGALGWGHVPILLAVVPAAFAIQIQDYLRQVLYVEGRARSALVNDVVNYGGLLAGIAVLAGARALTAERGLMVMAVVSGAAVVLGLFQLRTSMDWRCSRAGVLADNLENWRFGRWTLGMSALSVSSSYLTPFVLGAASSVAAAGALRAMFTVMGPVNIVFRTIGTSFVPAAARAFDRDGAAGTTALMRRAAVMGGVPVFAYSAAVAFFARPLLSFLYGADSYVAGIAWLLPIVALSFALGATAALLDVTLRAQRITSTPFRVSMANFILFWTLGAPLIYLLGLTGVGLTVVGVQVVAVVVLARRLAREVRLPRPGALREAACL